MLALLAPYCPSPHPTPLKCLWDWERSLLGPGVVANAGDVQTRVSGGADQPLCPGPPIFQEVVELLRGSRAWGQQAWLRDQEGVLSCDFISLEEGACRGWVPAESSTASPWAGLNPGLWALSIW